MSAVRILGVSGSLRADSHNSRLLAAAAQLLPADVEYVRFEGLKALPPFDEDDEPNPGPAVEHLRAEFATPEYNSSIPGQLKNAIDWASRPFEETVMRNRNAAVIGASTSMFGAVWAQAELRKILGAAGARVIDRELAVSYAEEQFDAEGRLTEPELQESLEDLVKELVEQARISAASLAADRS
jgi:chromate reductase